MNYFDAIYSKLFGKKDASPIVLIDDIIKRSASFVQQFQAWKHSDICDEFLNELWQSYFWRKKGIEKDPPMHLLETNHSNGFAINYLPEFGRSNFHFLFDYLADRVKGLDYQLVVSRQTMREAGDNVETKEMHYLKPKRSFVEPIDQQYGNVQIEFLRINDEPSRIKLIANSYPDRKYTQSKNFEELAQHIFKTE